MTKSHTGQSAFNEALRDARATTNTPNSAQEFAELVYSYYQRALADDTVTSPWTEKTVKEEAMKKW